MREPDGLHTLGRWTSDRARATPERIAVDDRGVVLSYRELDERAERLAATLRASGYGVGDRIATITGNSADQVVLLFACAKAGVALVPLSWRLTPRELVEQIEIADPALLLVEEEFAGLGRAVQARLPEPLPSTSLGTHGIEAGAPPSFPQSSFPEPHSFPEPVEGVDAGGSALRQAQGPQAQGPQAQGAQRPVHDDDALLIVFTSGTSSTPKGAVLSHANCFWTNLALSRIAEITAHDTVLAVMPQFHVGGWNIQPLLAWWVGATVVLERTFDPGRVLHLIAERRITTMMGVPANYLFLAQHPGFEAAELSSLRHAIVGGAPMPAALLRTWHARGVALSQGYGLTEASPNVLCLPDEDARARIGSAGKPYPHIEVQVADPVTGEPLDGPARGELLVRGPGVFSGYFRAPEETAFVLRGGWLHTGDLVQRDADGYFTVVDRIKDIFISGGESVAPAEVEGVLFGHPGVADVAVVGVPDDRWGEAGVAFVVRRAGLAVDETDLLDFARGQLAGFKVPRAALFTDEIPRSLSNKALRRVLVERWSAGVGGRR